MAKLRAAARGAVRTTPADGAEIDVMTFPQVARMLPPGAAFGKAKSSRSGTFAGEHRCGRHNAMERTDDNSEMGADLLSGVDRRWRTGLYRHLRGLGGRRALPVLCLRGDLPGAADP